MGQRNLTVWLGLLALLLAVLNLPPVASQAVKNLVRETIAPLQESTNRALRGLHEGLASVRGLGGLVEENRRLSREVVRLLAQQRDNKILQRENEELRRQAGFAVRSANDLVAGEVIARSRDGWWNSVRMNKGAGDGLQADQAVVSMEGLVGKIVAVSERTADVLLLSDPTCRVAAQILRTGSFGLVVGRGPSWDGQVVCRMEFINKNVRIEPGDEVISSGLGGVFPKGLLIGYVDRVYTDRSGLYQYADVISQADLGMLHYVYAVTQVSPGAPYTHEPMVEGSP
jgi:rod shape-determining protein MreC